jgi:5-methyltetrahydropteroyltriglutamate--homocysteine methyltransferase
MPIPTEPIGSIPRPAELIDAIRKQQEGSIESSDFLRILDKALRDTIRRFEETRSPVISDGEQAKPSFATYPLNGSDRLAPDGVVIPFEDGHTRQLPRLTSGPFRYAVHADQYTREAQKLTKLPVKQAVISPSALSLLYPAAPIAGYSRDQFLEDLKAEAEADIRRSLDAGAYCVQMDFTEGRLSLKLDPSGNLLRSFIDLNNQVLDRFTPAEQTRIGVHTCPGGDQDQTHSASVDYANLLPLLFELKAGRFYIQLASEPNRERVLRLIAAHLKPNHVVFVGVTDPLDPEVESPEEVRERVLQAAAFIPVAQLGTTDDCGFSPFADDCSTSRDVAFAKIRARVQGTALAAKALNVA